MPYYEVNYRTYSSFINIHSTVTILLHDSVQDPTLYQLYVCLVSTCVWWCLSQYLSFMILEPIVSTDQLLKLNFKSLLLILTENLNVCSVDFSCSVISDYTTPWMQHARLPCPSPTPGACSNSCPLSWWCHPTIPPSVVPFSSCLHSFPASGSL